MCANTEIVFTDDDIFTLPVKAIINPVNLVGVMGKGLALQFKTRYPECYELYKDACTTGKLYLGCILVYCIPVGESSDIRMVVNFPTKVHWKDPARYEYISESLGALVNLVNHNQISTIAIPPIGCGLGGLDKKKVLDMIESEFIVHVQKYLKKLYLVRF